MYDLIFSQLAEEFKSMIERIMKEERDKYLEENKSIRANGYYTRSPQTILGQMELSVPRTMDGKFKSETLPERKRVMFMFDDIIRRSMFVSGVLSRKLRYSEYLTEAFG